MIDKIIKQLNPLINGKLIYLSQYGSHLYGLNTENSDLDFRGVYIPTLNDIILKKDKDEINEELWITRYLPDREIKNDGEYVWTEVDRVESIKVDVKIFSLQKFITLCSKADTNALDLLFSYNPERKDIQQYVYNKEQYYESGILAHPYIPFIEFLINRGKLINTDRLESPITYAFKQATKYSLKGDYLNLYDELLDITKGFTDDMTVLNLIEYIDKNGLNYLREKNNDGFWTQQLCPITRDTKEKGGIQTYLNIIGVEHQANLSIRTFEERIKSKIKQYSKRAIDAKDGGNDWKALSHAIRVLLEVKQLLEDGTITFPCIENRFLLRIKQGKISREVIDEFFNKQLSNILEKVKLNELGWKYDEEFWNEFILKEVKNVNIS